MKKEKWQTNYYYVTLPEDLLLVTLSGCPSDFVEDVMGFRNHLLAGKPLETDRRGAAANVTIRGLLRGFYHCSEIRLIPIWGVMYWLPDITLEGRIRMSSARLNREVNIAKLGYDLDEVLYNERNGKEPTKGGGEHRPEWHSLFKPIDLSPKDSSPTKR